MSVSRVGLGFGLGGEFRRLESSDHFYEALKFSVSLGVNHIDSAQNYAAGQSEELIGALSKKSKQGLLIATKLDTKDYANHSSKAAIEGSLGRLGLDEIPLLYLHWPNPSVPIEETLGAMAQAVKEGKVRSIGLSNYSLEQIQKANLILGDIKISAIQSEYNLFDRSAEEDLIPYCLENSISFVAYSPLDQGRVLGDSTKLRLFNSIAERYGVTPAGLALAWLLKSSPAFLIPSSSNLARIEENSRALEVDLDEKTITEIDSLTRVKVVEIPASKIRVDVDETGRREVITSLEEALANRGGFSPSPSELAKELSRGAKLKPVRVKIKTGSGSGEQYSLTEGRVRFWAHVIEYGPDCLVPALVRV